MLCGVLATSLLALLVARHGAAVADGQRHGVAAHMCLAPPLSVALHQTPTKLNAFICLTTDNLRW